MSKKLIISPIPAYVWHFLPMFEYVCPQCGGVYYWYPKSPKPTRCQCGFQVTDKHRRPPEVGKSRKLACSFLRRHVFPRVPVEVIVKLKECLSEL